MSNRPWTPGPWSVCPASPCMVETITSVVAHTSPWCKPGADEADRKWADARLVASAPTLYEALNALLMACVQRLSKQDQDAISIEMVAASVVLYDAEHGDDEGGDA
jgi:hypothetical protein